MDTEPTGNKHMNSVLEQLRWKKFPVGSDGFICLVDAMGDDRSVVQAAAVSYGADTRRCDQCSGAGTIADMVICETCGGKGHINQKSDAAVRKLIRYLMKQRHCYHPDMEVLTLRGWVPWKDCCEHEQFLVPDPVTKQVTVERLPVEVFDADEEVVVYRNGRMSFTVTPDHKMWFKGKYQTNYAPCLAGEMQKWGHFEPLSGYGLFGSAGPACSMFKFIGFYLGDGSFASTNRVTFHLKKQRKKDYLEVLLKELKLEYTVIPSHTYEDALVYSVVTPEFMKDVLGDALGKRAAEKYLPEEILVRMGGEERRGLLDGLVNSDAHSRSDREQIQFSSFSYKLLQLFQSLCGSLGVDAHMTEGGVIAIAYTGNRTSLEARKQYFSREHYEGKVYCTTSSSGYLLVRGGPTKFGFICGNSTPFEMVELKFLVRVPMDCWRQWIRHRTANVNEYSTRYQEAIDAMSTTEATGWRVQATDNKQGSEGYLAGWPTDMVADNGQDVLDKKDNTIGWIDQPEEAGHYLTRREKEFHQMAQDLYAERLAFGVAREQARKDLPLSNYTEAYWKIDLHNLFHFLGLRMDRHAQLEIRQYADIIGNEIVKPLLPHCWEAFEDYRLNGIVLSGPERKLLGQLLDSITQAEVDRLIARTATEITAGTHTKMTPRDLADFASKLLPLPE